MSFAYRAVISLMVNKTATPVCSQKENFWRIQPNFAHKFARHSSELGHSGGCQPYINLMLTYFPPTPGPPETPRPPDPTPPPTPTPTPTPTRHPPPPPTPQSPPRHTRPGGRPAGPACDRPPGRVWGGGTGGGGWGCRGRGRVGSGSGGGVGSGVGGGRRGNPPGVGVNKTTTVFT